jgi:hypothetical protein
MKVATIGALVVLTGTALTCYASPHLTLKAIERGFNLYPGASRPFMLPDGRQIVVEYQRIEPRGGDEYAIIVRLAR